MLLFAGCGGVGLGCLMMRVEVVCCGCNLWLLMLLLLSVVVVVVGGGCCC